LRGRHGAAAVARCWQWLIDNEIEIVAFDEVQVRAAALAFDRYGKGIDPKAGLNLADCAAYALAGTMKCPLLFKGGDFTQTDVKACL
jgi:ribonuclease VapC